MYIYIYIVSIDFRYIYICSLQQEIPDSYPLYNPWVKIKATTQVFSVAAPTVWNSLPASVKLEGNILHSFRVCKNLSL